MRTAHPSTTSPHEESQLEESQDSLTRDGNFSLRKNYYIKRGRKGGKMPSKRHPYRHSLWTAEENASYAQFLQINAALFEYNPLQRKAIKLNVLMSRYIASRSPEQCRSHHQKMMQYHQNIGNILEHLGHPGLPLVSTGELAAQSDVAIRLCELTDENKPEEESLWSKLMRESATQAEKSLNPVDW